MKLEETSNGCLCKLVGEKCLVCRARSRNERDGRVCKKCGIGLIGTGAEFEHLREVDMCNECTEKTS